MYFIKISYFGQNIVLYLESYKNRWIILKLFSKLEQTNKKEQTFRIMSENLNYPKKRVKKPKKIKCEL
jgi:hypothetical protein